MRGFTQNRKVTDYGILRFLIVEKRRPANVLDIALNAVNGLHVLEFSSRARLDTFAIGSYPAPRMLPVPRRASSALTLNQNVFTLIDQGIAVGQNVGHRLISLGAFRKQDSESQIALNGVADDLVMV